MTNYVYDGANITGEVDAAGLVQARYAQGLGIDEPLATLRGGMSNFFAADGLGSITSLTDASGTIGTSYTYESFGGLLSTTGTLSNAVRYTGREYDSETGMYYYRARYYDPQIGRFTSEDPISFEGGGDFYTYASNSPVGIVDPTGFAPCKTPLYCAPSVLKAMENAYMRAVLANGAFTASSGYTQTEAGFPVTPTASGGYQAGSIVLGDRNGRLSIPLPTAAGGATFHTHLKGSGMPSTPKDNVTGSSDKGDTLAAVQSGFDVYVISGNGLAIAPASSRNPTDGKDSYFIIQGKNFGDWLKALKALCAKLAGGN